MLLLWRRQLGSSLGHTKRKPQAMMVLQSLYLRALGCYQGGTNEGSLRVPKKQGI